MGTCCLLCYVQIGTCCMLCADCSVLHAILHPVLVWRSADCSVLHAMLHHVLVWRRVQTGTLRRTQAPCRWRWSSTASSCRWRCSTSVRQPSPSWASARSPPLSCPPPTPPSSPPPPSSPTTSTRTPSDSGSGNTLSLHWFKLGASTVST